MNRLSLCAKDYADAMSDPFDCKEGACLPLATVVETQKSRVFVRTSFTTGTTGFGFVLLNPDLFGVGTQASVWCSTSAYAASAFTNVAAADVLATVSNAPFTNAMERRLVSVGIRVTNRTQVLYREGFVSGICMPNHETLVSLGASAIGAYDQCYRQVVDSGNTTYSVKWNGPKFSYEEEFNTGAGPFIEPCMGICAVSSGSNAQIYDVLVVGHYEFAGSLVRTKTMTWPDPQGASIVMGAQSRAAMLSTSASHDSPDWWRSFKSTLVEGAKLALPYVVPAAKAAAAYYTGGAASAALSLAGDSNVGRNRQGPKNDLRAVNKSSLLKDKKKKK